MLDASIFWSCVIRLIKITVASVEALNSLNERVYQKKAIIQSARMSGSIEFFFFFFVDPAALCLIKQLPMVAHVKEAT